MSLVLPVTVANKPKYFSPPGRGRKGLNTRASYTSREVINMARGRPPVCPYCSNAGSVINKGFRKTKTMGKRRIKLCKACGRKFTPKNQKSVELTEEKVVEANAEPDKASVAGVVTESNETAESDKAAKPGEEPKPLLNALDEEWTS